MKERLDLLLVRKGLVRSRSQARDLIKLRRVIVDGKICDKPGAITDGESQIELLRDRKYVSRAAEKLERAYEVFALNFEGKVVCDVGASKGGFTQFAIEHGARKVYAVDVGSNQLDESLRRNPRVICLENFNARQLSPEVLGETVDIVLCDVSFISVKLLLKPMNSILRKVGQVVLLIKPQFEMGLSKNKSKTSHRDAIEGVLSEAVKFGLVALDLTYSPITGCDGDIEYLAFFVKDEENNLRGQIDETKIECVVDEAWRIFRGGK
ncbi:MAG: TlyA family RNA methyltransferase [Pseudothermotoga sp.]